MSWLYSYTNIKITKCIIKQHWPDWDGKHTIGVLTIPTDGDRGSVTVSCGARTGIGVRSMPSVGDRGSSSRDKKSLDAADTGGGEENWDWSSPAASNPNSCLLTKPPISTVHQLVSPVYLKQLTNNSFNTVPYFLMIMHETSELKQNLTPVIFTATFYFDWLTCLILQILTSSLIYTWQIYISNCWVVFDSAVSLNWYTYWRAID